MKLKYINATEPDLAYIIKDVSPEVNWPALRKNEILVVGRDRSNLQQISYDNLSTVFKDSKIHYKVLVNKISISNRFDLDVYENYLELGKSTLSGTFLSEFEGKDLLREINGEYKELIPQKHDTEFTKNTINVDGVRNIYFYDLNEFYDKDGMDTLATNKLYELSGKILTVSGIIMSTYFRKDEMPILEENKALTGIVLPEIKGFSNPFDDVNVDGLSSIVVDDDFTVEFKEKVEKIKNAVLELEWFRNADSYSKIKFKAYDPFTQKFIVLDKIYINGISVPFTVDADLTHHISRIVSNIYEMTLTKNHYIPVWFKMESEFSTNVRDIDEFNLGNVIMLSIHSQLKFIFTWGEIPDDLDTHVYSFDADGVQHEHAYFNQLKSEESGIDIDHDDVDQYGPETTLLLLPKNDWYYLITIHNYSLHYFKDENMAHMNWNGETNLRAELYGWNLDVKPIGDFNGYWWDVLVVHNGKIYVLNEYPTDRGTYFQYNLNAANCKRLINKVNRCTDVHDIAQLGPTEIRFY